MDMKNEQVTIYVKTAFGIHKSEGKLQRIGVSPYAQYSKSPFVEIIPKGKRKPVGYRSTYQPYLVVLKGVGHPDPLDPFTSPKLSSSGLVVKETRMSSFDEGYQKEFDKVLDPVIQSSSPESILMDFRFTVGTENLNTN